MSIGCKMRSLGESTYFMRFLEPRIKELIGETPYKLDYVNGQRKVIIHTDRIDNEKLEAIKNAFIELGTNVIVKEEQYNHHIEISWRDINKYAACTTVAEVAAVNPDYKNDLTSDGEWVYPLPELVQAGGHTKSLFTNARNLRKVKLNLPKATDIGWLCYDCTLLKEIDIEAPAVNYGNYQACAHIIQGSSVPQKMRFVLPSQRFLDQLLWSWAPATPQHLELYAPKMESAWNAFIYASLDKPSVMGIFNQLQTFTGGNHPLDIGIHVDHKNDEEILEAIANAETKGWTLTVQWKGTPTSTTSTFNLGTIIYAKAGESELPDGTIEKYLDWGHYVTNWEERGYEQFRSLESAYKHFGLEIPKEEIEI